MTVHDPDLAHQQTTQVFPQDTLATFSANYPETPHTLAHRLQLDERLTLDALTSLAGQLADASIEYNRGNLPVGVDGKPGSNGLTIEETIRQIATSDSWAALKNIEQVPAYRALLFDLLEELRPAIEATTGPMLTPQAFVFISSPDAVTPYHYDPEHNILLQLTGSKIMTQFPPATPASRPTPATRATTEAGRANCRGPKTCWPAAPPSPSTPARRSTSPSWRRTSSATGRQARSRSPSPGVAAGAMPRPRRVASTPRCAASASAPARPAGGPPPTVPSRPAGASSAA